MSQKINNHALILKYFLRYKGIFFAGFISLILTNLVALTIPWLLKYAIESIKEVMSRIENEYNINEGGTTEDRRFSLEGVRCLGACGLAPVMVIGPDTHGDVSSDKIIDILEKYE